MPRRILGLLVAAVMSIGALVGCTASPTPGVAQPADPAPADPALPASSSHVTAANSPVPDTGPAADPGELHGLAGLTDEVARQTISRKFAERGTASPDNPCTAQIDFGAIRIAAQVSTHQVEYGKDAQPVIVVQPEYSAVCTYPDPEGAVGFIDASYQEKVPNSNQRNYYFYKDAFDDWTFVYGG